MRGTNTSSVQEKLNPSNKNYQARRARLNKRLAEYSTTVSAAVAATAGTTIAPDLQAVIVNVPTANLPNGGNFFANTSLDWDINNDGVVDLRFGSAPIGTGPGLYLSILVSPNAALIGFAQYFPSLGGSYYDLSNLAPGAQIGGTANNFVGRNAAGLSASVSSTSYVFFATSGGAPAVADHGAFLNTTGLLGFRFDQDPGLGVDIVHGWARLQTDFPATGGQGTRVLAAAYEDSGAAIGAGDTGVPEPATFGLGLLAMGAVGISAFKRRRQAETGA